MKRPSNFLLFSTALTGALMPLVAQANPEGGVVAAGAATISSSGNTLTINQSTDRAIIDWRSFNIAPNETTRFNQPSSSSHTLNRVNDTSRSVIEGTIQANGNITIINPNGVFFSAGSVVDVSGLTATSADTSNADFMAGRVQHTIAGNADAKIVNEGNITVRDAGLAAFVAPGVENNGTITARLGKVKLAAGETFTLDMAGDGHLQVAVSADLLRTQVANSGAIIADGGTVHLTTAAARSMVDSLITNTGVIEAKEGHITADGTFVALGGKLSTSGARGGTIDIKAQQLSLAENIEARGSAGAGGAVTIHSTSGTLETSTSRIDVSGSTAGGSITHTSGGTILSSGTYVANSSAGIGGSIDVSAKDSVGMLRTTLHANGATGGGRVRVGGEFQGGKHLSSDELINATSAVINDGSSLQAKATGTNGDGGSVIVWSDETTLMHGAVDVTPGSLSGAGGFVELSSAENLTTSANVITGVGSRQGQLLLDPKNITIADTTGYNPLALLMGRGYGGAGQFDVTGLNNEDIFGQTISLDGNRMAVGAYGGDGFGNGWAFSGEVYLFSFTNENFAGASLEGMIGRGYVGGKNINMTQLEANDFFGVSVALDGNRLAVGASGGDGFGNGFTDSGEVYLFSFTDANFSGGVHEATIGRGYTGGKNINFNALENSDVFGSSIALDGNRLAVGAWGGDGFGNGWSLSGEVHLFSFADSAFSGGVHEATIGRGYTGGKNINLTNLEVNDYFGDTLSLKGNLLAVGAYGGDGFGNVASESGDVYLFSFTDSNFSGGVHEATMGRGYVGGKNVNVTELTATDWFGNRVALDDGRLYVGVTGDDGFGNAFSDTGAVYVYQFTGNFNGLTREFTIGRGYTGTNDINVTSLDNVDWFGWGLDADAGRLVVGAPTADGSGNAFASSGEVYAFNFNGNATLSSGSTFSTLAGNSITIAPSALLSVLNTGTAVTLQANNDIFLNSDLLVNNMGGNGGWLTLQAGRSILLNANITTDNGNLTLIGNDNLASGVVDMHRDAGAAVITQAAGTTINAGTGIVDIQLRAGTGKTHSTAGDITLRNITAGSIAARGFANTSDIVLNGALSGTLAGNAITLASGRHFINNAGAGALSTPLGRWLVYSQNPANNTLGGLSAAFTRFSCTFAGSCPPLASGNGLLYSVSAPANNTVSIPDSVRRIMGDATILQTGIVSTNLMFMPRAGTNNGSRLSAPQGNLDIHEALGVGEKTRMLYDTETRQEAFSLPVSIQFHDDVLNMFGLSETRPNPRIKSLKL